MLQAVQERTVELAIALAADAPAPIRHLNIGGGFGIPYFPKDVPLDIAPIGEALGRLIEKRVKPALPQAQLIIELGRYIIGEAGIYVSRIIDRKELRGQVFLVLRWRAPSPARRVGEFRPGDPAQLSRGDRQSHGASPWRRPLRSSAACARRSIFSPTRWNCPGADVGDLVVVFQSGAYGLTASPSRFLGHPEAPEILV